MSDDEIQWRDDELNRLGEQQKQYAVVMPLAQRRIAELEATIETMRSQYTDLLLCSRHVEAELQKQVERREGKKHHA